MFGVRFWGVSVLYTVGAALLIGIPTVLVPNHFFIRMTPTSAQDYVIWSISVVLLGPVMALATLYPAAPATGTAERAKAGSGKALIATILSFFSVGCPICNKLVVFLLGMGGAMTLFNPLRPFLGAASIVLLTVTLFLRVRVLRHGCTVNFESTSASKAPEG